VLTVTLTATSEIPDEEGDDIGIAIHHVADLLDEGYTSGILNGGAWDYTIEGEPEPSEDDEEEDEEDDDGE